MERADIATLAGPDWDALDATITGRVVRPGSPDYDLTCKSQIARFDAVRPQAVVFCNSLEDVAAAIAFARRHAIPMAPRSGGHCFAGHSSSEGMVIDVTLMSAVTVSDGLATIGAGARLDNVYDRLLEHGLTIPAGSCPTVGIAGLTLGGGLGILGRTYGLTCDSLVAAQVVLADGRIVTCDERREPDLFWALRGAGARNFGIVTELVFRPMAPPSATGFQTFWPLSRVADLVFAWQQWSLNAPDALAASLVLTAGGDPAGPPVLKVFGAMLGTEAETLDLLDELANNVGVKPTSTFARSMTYREAKRYLASLGESEFAKEPTGAGHAYNKSEFFRTTIPKDAVAALVEHLTTDRIEGQSRELDFNPWGGAYNRVDETATAFVHRNEIFLLKHTAAVAAEASADERKTTQQWLDRSWELARPWGTGRAYQNFPDPDLADFETAYYGSNRERLVDVKRKYDPENFFRFNQSIGRG
ncbi:FAD-binding oxidoreductase [Chelativorans salis]|uniref:FAD-binding oxidoreductase n=1 Tax=Chelativorans salis TaxID=2978478 RepID=A0ABT2LII9_9HYPH|nr:FAD-binding oxidoreductase [Chelativorans sp. EGI FJ00035]MCT7374340.1 FAD-binding oxidoreductase [Chelativorans sp. EGI FJ00035]